MASGFWKIFKGLSVKAEASSTANTLGDIETISGTSKIQFHNGTSVSPIVTEDHTATLTNKTLTTPTITVRDNAFTMTDNSDTSKIAVFECSSITTATTRTFTFPDNDGTLITSATGVDLTTTQTLQNKSLVDSTTFVIDNSDNTKKMQFQCSGITTGTTRTLTIPNADTTLAGLAVTETFTAPQTISISTGFPLTVNSTTAHDPHLKFDSDSTSNDYKIGISSGTFEFLDNGNNIRGSVTQNGLWTLGTSSGTQTHVINGQVSVMGGASGFPATLAKSGSDPHLKFDTGGSNDVKIGSTSGGIFEILDNSNNVLGQVTQASQWTLGTGSGTQSGPKIYGVNDATAATSGTVGEYLESKVTTNTNFPAAIGSWGDATSLSLTAGDWDLSLQFGFALNSSTVNEIDYGISTTSGNSASGLTSGDNKLATTPPTATSDSSGATLTWRQNISSTTTYYAKLLGAGGAGTPQYVCKLSARRVR